MFALEMFAYGALWLAYSSREELTDTLVVFVSLLLCVYVWMTLVFGRLLRRMTGGVVIAALALRDRDLALGLGSWLAFKGVLYALYGSNVLLGLESRVAAGVPQMLVDLDRFLLWPAWGAYFAYAIRSRPRNLLEKTGVLSLVFLIVNLLFENNGGGKRLLISTAILVVYLRSGYRGVTLRKVIACGLFAYLTVLGVDYYERIRANFADLVNVSPSRTVLTINEIKEALVPRSGSTVGAELEIREAPLSLLYGLTRMELGGTIAKGQVVGQVLENLAPAGIVEKHFQDEDGVISKVFNFPTHDLATTALGVIQAELFIAAYVATPAIYVFLFWTYCDLLIRRIWEADGSITTSFESLALLGGALSTCLSIECGLTGLFGTARDVAGILVAGWIVRLVGKAGAGLRRSSVSSRLNGCTLRTASLNVNS
jgi:hypothetical protein